MCMSTTGWLQKVPWKCTKSSLWMWIEEAHWGALFKGACAGRGGLFTALLHPQLLCPHNGGVFSLPNIYFHKTGLVCVATKSILMWLSYPPLLLASSQIPTRNLLCMWTDKGSPLPAPPPFRTHGERFWQRRERNKSVPKYAWELLILLNYSGKLPCSEYGHILARPLFALKMWGFLGTAYPEVNLASHQNKW